MSTPAANVVTCARPALQCVCVSLVNDHSVFACFSVVRSEYGNARVRAYSLRHLALWSEVLPRPVRVWMLLRPRGQAYGPSSLSQSGGETLFLNSPPVLWREQPVGQKAGQL